MADWKKALQGIGTAMKRVADGPLGGGKDELGRDDLLDRAEEGILALRRFGSRGSEVFPAEVEVRISVAEGSAGVVRGFVEDPAFDRALEARLLNRLAKPGSLPLRRYAVSAGSPAYLSCEEVSEPAPFELRVDGGDCDGATLALAPGQGVVRLGRGRWHGPDDRETNDLVVTEHEEFVSRRAAVLWRAGGAFEAEARDQGECLVVERPGGEKVRPRMTGSGRVVAKPGDVIAFTDGAGRAIRVRILRSALSNGATP